MTKDERLKLRSNEIGTKHVRKLRKYSDNFLLIFNFFLKSNRLDLLTFCGSHTIIEFDINAPSAKECFRLYEDGFFKNKPIITKHPNILKSVLIGKKAWGLWVKEWTEGISECSFTKYEILNEFSSRDITIPESFLDDFNNVLYKKENEIYI
jgi:hypothetical protein